jgi:ribosomal protein S18 acetylase RimI-like enzyme
MNNHIDGLMNKLDDLHATELGAERVRRNLSLRDGEDAMLWCKETVKQADIIIGQGKNWYVYRKGAVITIHARSNTIITAQPLNAKVREMRESDYPCLPEFCYQAIFIPKGVEPPPRSIVDEPEIFIYIKDFGAVRGDHGVVAEQNRQIIGAAWTRIIPAYGHVDSETPELAIAVLPEFRGYGIGGKLMKKLFSELRKNGYARTSLSVRKDNPAVRFYKRLGYEVTGDKLDHARHEDYILMKDLGVKPKARIRHG